MALRHVGDDEWTDESGRRWRAHLKWGVVGGRAEPVSIEITSADGHPVTAAAVRAYPLAEFIRSNRERHNKFLKVYADDETLDPATRKAAKRRMAEFSARRGVAHSPEGLEAVADVYRKAFFAGESVTKAVADAFGIAPSTAAKRIMAARRAHLLDGIGNVR
jgi:hypothetical protein